MALKLVTLSPHSRKKKQRRKRKVVLPLNSLSLFVSPSLSKAIIMFAFQNSMVRTHALQSSIFDVLINHVVYPLGKRFCSLNALFQPGLKKKRRPFLSLRILLNDLSFIFRISIFCQDILLVHQVLLQSVTIDCISPYGQSGMPNRF